MASRLDRRRSERNASQGWSNTTIVLLALLLIAVAAASYVYFTGGLSVTKSKRQADFATDGTKINILVLGVDERSDDKTCSRFHHARDRLGNTHTTNLLSV